jgi:hypothetical protein
MKTIQVPVGTLLESLYNPREITDHDFNALKDSIKEFGFVEPVVANKNNQIVGGHMRWRAAKDLGMETVPVVYVDLPPEKEKILSLALNRISGRWDQKKLEALIKELSLTALGDLHLSGFENWELELYTPPMESMVMREDKNLSELVGEQPNRSYVFHITSDNQDDCMKICMALSGKTYRSIQGTDALKMLNLPVKT